MKRITRWFVIIIVFILTTFLVNTYALAQNNKGYFLLKVYHYGNAQQEEIINNFLQNSFVPMLHGNGLANIGVFKALGNDTVADKKMYVFIPFKSLKEWEKFMQSANADLPVNTTAEYGDAAYDKPVYSRIENILMSAFKFSPQPAAPKFNTTKSDWVYELRSYESSTEKLHASKVQMFNEGGEVGIFKRLGFNAVFYGRVLFGSRMPNLMYMTSFENMNARTEHWKNFSSDAEWKTLSARKEYQHNVSVHDISFLQATNYSDL